MLIEKFEENMQYKYSYIYIYLLFIATLYKLITNIVSFHKKIIYSPVQ